MRRFTQVGAHRCAPPCEAVPARESGFAGCADTFPARVGILIPVREGLTPATQDRQCDLQKRLP